MRMILMSAALSLYAATALAAGPSCKETATKKKLAGAALTSFMTKCQKGCPDESVTLRRRTKS